MNSKAMSQAVFGILLAGALAFPVQAGIVTGNLYCNWDAATDTAGNNTWATTGYTAGTITFGSSLSPDTVSDSRFVTLTKVYTYPAAKSIGVSGLPNSVNATWEFVLKTDGTAGIILDTGGFATGGQVDINASGVLRAGVTTGGAPRPQYTLTATDKTRFIHVVVVLTGNSNVKLYVDNVLQDTKNWSSTSWSGANAHGVGDKGSDAPFNDYTAPFAGQIAIFRYYQKAFTATDVAQNFATLSDTPFILGAATATAFTTTYGTASATQSFAISGDDLTADITATAPTGFEVSSDGTTYGSTATFTQSGGSASGTLRIRLAATAAVGSTIYDSQNIVLSSSGATSVNITTASTGNMVSPAGSPVITATGTLSAMLTATGLPSVATSFLVSGTNMVAGITVTPPAGLEVSTTSDFSSNVGNSGAPITIGTSGTIAATTVYVRLAATASVGNYNSLNIVLSSGGAASVNVPTSDSGNRVASPAISSTGTLVGMSTKTGTASVATSFSVSGADMVAGITVTPPSGLEVSTTSATSGFAGSGMALTVGSSGTIAATTVYVRLAATAPLGTYDSLNIVLSSSGAASVNVPTSASGNIVGNPVISATGALGVMSSTYGTASAATSFSVSGSDMIAGITVKPPSGLEVSTTSDSSGFTGNGTALTVGSSGTIAETTVYVRLAATAGVGTYNFKNIVLSSSSATNVNVSTTASGNTVSGATVTYGFDDGTLQGWTTVSSDPGNSPYPESYVSANYDTAQEGSMAAYCNNFNRRDDAHKPLWIRSPEFVINQSGYLTLWLLGGAGLGGFPGTTGTLPTHESQITLGVDSTISGVMGVALRDVATGDFVLTGQRITSAGGANWVQIAWDVSAYRNNGKHYTLELFDYHSGNGYSQLAMDSVSIPGTLVSDLPQGTMIRFY